MVYPRGMPKGMPLGYPPPHHRSPLHAEAGSGTAGRTGTGLWAQAGSQGPGAPGSRRRSRRSVTVSSAVLARSAELAKGQYCERLDMIQVQPALGRPGCTGVGGIVVRVLGPSHSAGRDRRDGDGGRDGTGRDGTDAQGRLILQQLS